MQVGYVVLYVDDIELCRSFGRDRIGMVEKRCAFAGTTPIPQLGFPDQDFSFELVPRALMADNPDEIDMATPSLCFHVDDLVATRSRLRDAGVDASEIGDAHGTASFAFPDPEGRWFAVIKRP
ncbi:MAG: VOC family protein [Armatimonadota bacterium]